MSGEFRRGKLAEDHRSRTCPDRWRPQLDLKSSRLTGDDDLPRLDCYMEAGRIIATSLSFYIPQISFFRLIHAAYYHESIIIHIKLIFYNDI